LRRKFPGENRRGCGSGAVLRLPIAEGSGIFSPLAEARRDHVGDNAADVALLRRVVVGTGVIAGYRHRPGLVALMQPRQKSRRIIDVAARVEHLLDAAEILRMVMMVDLHAAEIDQLGAAPAGAFEGRNGVTGASGEHGFSFYVQGVGLKAAFPPGLGQANGIEDAGGHAIAVCGTQDFGFAGILGGRW
jgi:hypothetical protein